MTALARLRPGWRAWLLASAPHSRWQARLGNLYLGWLTFRGNPLALAGGGVIAALLLVALLAPALAPGSPYAQDLNARLLAPSAQHWFGTDELGRDLYTRVIYGARVTLTIVVLVAVIVAPVGLLVGTAAGYLGGIADAVLMRTTDVFLAFPRLILALAFVAAIGPGIENAVIAIALTSWPPYARVARAETLMLRNSDFISAVRLQGASGPRIVLRHIVPLCLSSVIIRVTLDMAGIILTAAGLGFLGLGAQPPTPEWGAMASSGREFLLDQWWVATIPGIAIFVVSLGFNLLGDGLRDVLDPKQRLMADDRSPLLTVDDLRVRFATRHGMVEAVRGVSFALGREKLGIVGKSGSGKSMTGRSILRLVPPPGQVHAGAINFDGLDLARLSERDMRRIRGKRISMVLQDPKFSLNPVMTVGSQIIEAYRVHTGAARVDARDKAMEMLAAVRIRDPQRVYGAYPHELSGGMGQRVMIAMMLAPDPDLLIADEPTSALDVTVQMQVLAIIDDLVTRRGMGLIFISHDLNLVASFCDRVLIMYAGRIVEACRAGELHRAQHPYTQGLLASLPRVDRPVTELPVLQRDPAWAR